MNRKLVNHKYEEVEGLIRTWGLQAPPGLDLTLGIRIDPVANFKTRFSKYTKAGSCGSSKFSHEYQEMLAQCGRPPSLF